ncbi:hypothetical protein UFOVP1475_46 [uncultured Caudovirales phage]|jgi:hypothetical protein|uniref:Uncharacterized protein n=1 Tax=uncultured Caudovirales phage TaxID=2100421 RepID=A0A6J5SLU0_9CAUD|nr:hypothetical protein UFOVP1475_46 [uncultured Caudovirales phage]
MPIPSVNKGEDQSTYVGRCMHEIASEYDTNEQAVAICINTYEKSNMSEDTTFEEMKKLIKSQTK